jgi:hypothetical protein
VKVRVAFDVEPGVLARLHLDPAAFTREFRIAAAVAWYERQLVSQGRAAEIAGLSRAEFIDALGRYGVSPFQDTLEELRLGSSADSEKAALLSLANDGLVTAPVRKMNSPASLVRLDGPRVSETLLEDRIDRF